MGRIRKQKGTTLIKSGESKSLEQLYFNKLIQKAGEPIKLYFNNCIDISKMILKLLKNRTIFELVLYEVLSNSSLSEKEIKFILRKLK